MTNASDEEAYTRLAAEGAAPLWRYYGSLFLPEPKPTAVPIVWHYKALREVAMHFAESLSIEDAARRVLMLVNPGLQDPPATVNTLFSGIQILLPGEQAPAHRHTANAFRFVIEGSGVYTTVDGERLYMNPGDLLLTAGWKWHDHFHPGDNPMLWLDGLDYPLVNLLEAGFYEQGADRFQKSVVPDGISTRQFIHGRLNPVWLNSQERHSPLGSYPWVETERALAAIGDDADGCEHDGVSLEYTNPLDGGSVLPTIGCRVQRLRPGFVGRPRRQTSSVICHVVRGSGSTEVGGKTLEWQEKDVFVIPGWLAYQHRNGSRDEDAVLFTSSNEPVMKALNLYREEAV
ncbi:cupin domain-containing protein [Nocardioides sp. LS1]|uniref:cupin domain-containing protein n=1 Tax=Nocardioides sp. LS1 TaxID=1027620 RepID=UPI000F624F65|nr:cupin domain-containing protein [Nocardioides sp. LS1]GCD91106.1 gentisate 1,2-dioxygenase [Nocardioides sp. LS1]